MDQRQEILHEVAVLRLADKATRIVKLLEVYETPTEMALVLELLVFYLWIFLLLVLILIIYFVITIAKFMHIYFTQCSLRK